MVLPLPNCHLFCEIVPLVSNYAVFLYLIYFYEQPENTSFEWLCLQVPQENTILLTSASTQCLQRKMIQCSFILNFFWYVSIENKHNFLHFFSSYKCKFLLWSGTQRRSLAATLSFKFHSSDSCWRKEHRQNEPRSHERLLWRQALLEARMQ